MNAQTIRRAEGIQNEIRSGQVPARIRPDIFSELPRLEADISAKKIEFTGDICYLVFNDASCQFKMIDSNVIQFQGYGNSFLINRERSEHNIWFNRPGKTRKAISVYQWIPHRNTDKKTEWKWEPATDSVPDIPSYDYYAFKLDENKVLYLFEIKDAPGKTEYYLVNASYLYATDAGGLNYVLVDADCNGKYTDPADRILFMSWDPYRQDSKYRELTYVRENTWYEISRLNRQFFSRFSFEAGKLNIENGNDQFKDSIKTGRITFTKIPKEASLLINGVRYPMKKGKNILECGYGFYNAQIVKDGYLDFDTSFCISGSQERNEIRYVKTAGAGILTVRNIFSGNFFVTVKGTNGAETFYRQDRFNLPEGKYEIEVYTGGIAVRKQIEIKLNTTVEIDFENELKK